MICTLDHSIQEQAISQSISGFSLASVKDQEVVYSNGFGMTNLKDSGVPVTANTFFEFEWNRDDTVYAPGQSILHSGYG